MKKVLLATVAILTVATAFAQVHIGGGYINSADRYRSSKNADVEVTNINGAYAGLGFTLPLGGDLAVTPGVYYTYLTSHNASSFVGGFVSAAGDLQEHYVNVPVTFTFGDNLSSNFRLFFFGGPTLSYGLISKTKLSASVAGFGGSTTIDNYNDVRGYGRWDVLLGAGMGIDLGPIRLTAGYDFGMLNRYTESATSIVRHRNQIHAGIGFLF